MDLIEKMKGFKMPKHTIYDFVKFVIPKKCLNEFLKMYSVYLSPKVLWIGKANVKAI